MLKINRLAGRLAWLKEGRAPVASCVGRALLARPFPRDASRRILLVYIDHALAYTQFNALLRYESRFAERGMYFRAVPYGALDIAHLPDRLDALFLQSPYIHTKGGLNALLASIKQARPDLRIAYFDWFAPTDVRFAEQVHPWADSYVKKSLLRDHAQYLVPTVGHTTLADYYAPRFGVGNPPPDWVVPASMIDRLAVGPAFSTSEDLIGLFEVASAPPQGFRSIDLHARIATKGEDWYGAMRREAAAAVTSHFSDLTVASQGFIAKKDYMRELEQSKLCFSPFGYGEICWRDFEAIAAGAVIVKQDMNHIETAPDIYIPFETYIPVRWDLGDLNERVRAALGDPDRLRKIAERAFTIVREHLLGNALVDLVDRLAGIGYAQA